MNRFKSIVIIFIGILLLTGCTMIKDQQYYKEIANTVISLFRNINYDDSEFTREENNAINKIISELTHKDQEVNVSDFIIKNSEYYVNEKNTEGIYKKGNECFISYDDLNLKSYEENNEHYELEPHKRVVCDGYYTVLYLSDFYPEYEETQKNPLHNYSYLKGYKTETGYNYVYKSTYDGSYLTVVIDLDDGTNISLMKKEYTQDELEINDEKTTDELVIVFLIIILIVGIALLVPILLKNKDKRSGY